MIPTWFPYYYSKNVEMFDIQNCQNLKNIRNIVAFNTIIDFVIPKNAKRSFITAIMINFDKTALVTANIFSFHLDIDGVPCSQFRDRPFSAGLFLNGIPWVPPIKLKALQRIEIFAENTPLGADSDLGIAVKVWGFHDYQIEYDFD